MTSADLRTAWDLSDTERKQLEEIRQKVRAEQTRTREQLHLRMTKLELEETRRSLLEQLFRAIFDGSDETQVDNETVRSDRR